MSTDTPRTDPQCLAGSFQQPGCAATRLQDDLRTALNDLASVTEERDRLRDEQFLSRGEALRVGFDGGRINEIVAALRDERDSLKRELEEARGQGTLHGRLQWLAEYAEQHCGHSPSDSMRGPEQCIIEKLEAAEQQLAAGREAVIEKGILAEQRSSDRIVALQDAVIGLEAKDIELARALSIQRELLEQECQDGDKILALFPHLTRTEGGRLPIPRLLNTIRTLSASAAKEKP